MATKDLEVAEIKTYYVPLTKVYLAIPYTGMEELSFKMANEVAAQLLALKLYPFSPISHSHEIAKTGLCQDTAEMWLDLDKNFVEWCDEVYVIVPHLERTHEGLLKVLNSKGVMQEILWAKEFNKPVKFISYNIDTKVMVPYDSV